MTATRKKAKARPSTSQKATSRATPPTTSKTSPSTEPPTPQVTSPRPAKPKRMGCLDAAAQVLGEAGDPLTCGQMMEHILEKRLWTTTGKTPAATLYSAILREIQRKGDQARFILAERGKFTLKA